MTWRRHKGGAIAERRSPSSHALPWWASRSAIARINRVLPEPDRPFTATHSPSPSTMERGAKPGISISATRRQISVSLLIMAEDHSPLALSRVCRPQKILSDERNSIAGAQDNSTVNLRRRQRSLRSATKEKGAMIATGPMSSTSKRDTYFQCARSMSPSSDIDFSEVCADS